MTTIYETYSHRKILASKKFCSNGFVCQEDGDFHTKEDLHDFLRQSFIAMVEGIQKERPEFIDIPQEIVEMGSSFVQIWQRAYAQGFNANISRLESELEQLTNNK
jgi:hypothetical protein